MIKVLIADDENRICHLIQALVDWDRIAMTVVGMASNGLEALAMIGSENPDILITDIRMPGCNGLELIEKAKKHSPQLRIIIISGYAHFEYAQEAIKYGVTEYLLKPINKIELTDTLQKIKIKILDERKADVDLAGIREDYENGITKLRSVLIQDLLDNDKMPCSMDILRNQYHFMAQPGYFQAFCMKIDCASEKPGRLTMSVMTDKFNAAVMSGLAKNCYDYVVMQRDHMVYGVMNYAPKGTDNVRKILRSSLNQIDAQKGLIGAADLSLGLGTIVRSPEELSKSLDTATVGIEERLIAGTGKLLDGFEKKPLLFEKKLLDKYARNLGQALDTLDTTEMEKEADRLYDAVQENSEIHGWEILKFVKSAGSLFVMRLDVKNETDFLDEFRKSCDDCRSTKMLFDELKNLERKFMNVILTERGSNLARSVRLGKQYIQNHYSEQISLEEVSGKVGLSAPYFSVLFKKETEIGFAKYLMNTRMDAAKVLLRETTLPVAQICQKVGYYDLKHFTHTFEKTAGVKPTVFRKMYG